jgi:hypothetical protein
MENKVLERQYNETVVKLQIAEKAKRAKLARKIEALEGKNREWKKKIETLRRKFDTDDDSD